MFNWLIRPWVHVAGERVGEIDLSNDKYILDNILRLNYLNIHCQTQSARKPNEIINYTNSWKEGVMGHGQVSQSPVLSERDCFGNVVNLTWQLSECEHLCRWCTRTNGIQRLKIPSIHLSEMFPSWWSSTSIKLCAADECSVYHRFSFERDSKKAKTRNLPLLQTEYPSENVGVGELGLWKSVV